MKRLLELLILLVLCFPIVTGQASTEREYRPIGTAATQGNQGNPDVKVWVNTASGVYHCPGARWYGATKHGEYMSQAEAQKKNYRPAYGKVCR